MTEQTVVIEEVVNGTEVNTESEASTLLDEMAVRNVKADNNDLVKGFLMGLGAGLVIGAAAWFMERNKRMQLLKQMELTTDIALAIAQGKQVLPITDKKEIDLAQYVITNPSNYVRTIMDNLDKVKFMRKSEKERWKKTMRDITDLTIIWHKKEQIAAKRNHEIPAAEATEVLNEK